MQVAVLPEIAICMLLSKLCIIYPHTHIHTHTNLSLRGKNLNATMAETGCKQ